MMSNSDFGSISFDLPKNQSNVIKVIGVGGGGSNAINYMFKQGIKGVDFIVCNTDSQALENSAVPNKIQLGVTLTEGLGAGANPDVGQQSAIESITEIEKMLDSNTKMVFITAGMGGGTGTGAAPVIAQLAKERGILTVGIVTKPFQFEGKVRYEQALFGVEKLRKHVDSLIVINNNKLREVYGNLGFKAGFSKADEVLATASRGIAEVITHHYTQNIDLKDAKTVLSESGTAIMGSAVASGENRAKEAIIAALDSPLLDDNKITGAKNVLLLIVSGTSEITIDEIGEINDHIQAEAGFNANIIMGVGDDESLGEDISVTIIATGFNIEQQNDIVNTEPKKIIHTLGNEQKLVQDLSNNKEIPNYDFSTFETKTTTNEEKIVFELIEDEEEFDIVAEKQKEELETPTVETPTFNMDLVPTSEFLKNLEVTFEIVAPDFEDYYFSAPEVNEIEINSLQPIFQQEEQITFSFDIPVDKKENPKSEDILFQLTEETKNIFVNEPVQFVPMTELNQDGIVKYSLEEFMDVDNKLENSKPNLAQVEEPIEEELNITVKEVDMTSNQHSIAEEISPMEMTLKESAKIIVEERRRKLKEFNYKFHNNPSKVDEYEKEPAYKRSGIELSTPQPNSPNSRTSLGTDSNNDNQLRTNNSFLHDNVD
ncbi:MAG: cell division protein FtsZ [Flavobacteriaceae bacterium]|nr:cell division protein FtsZ [Flavobacteriaceae bacterium]